ncbi:MAG: hypothetical protein M0R80_06940 [Proteobacteria bacterium]|nr:hypothetical protein [Pseudomonadota bacterium]
MYGPVGSLGTPESEEGHEVFDADGIRVFVNADVMAEVKAGVLRFNFGQMGWAQIALDAQPGEPAESSPE